MRVPKIVEAAQPSTFKLKEKSPAVGLGENYGRAFTHPHRKQRGPMFALLGR